MVTSGTGNDLILLSFGDNTLTDSGGATASSSVVVTVKANVPPVATVAVPTSG